MKRKTSTVPSLIYTYGCPLGVNEGLAQLNEQLRRAHRYYNDLIQVRREAREAYCAARLLIDSELAELEKQRLALTEKLKTLRTDLKALRIKSRKRVDSAELRGQIEAVIKEKKTLAKTTKAVRQRLKKDPALRRAAKEINARANQRMARLRKDCGVYWGTYLMVEKAVEAACKSAAPPEPHRWTGCGRVGVQLQKGRPTSAIMGGKCDLISIGIPKLDPTTGHVQLVPFPPDTWDTRSGRRHARGVVRMRIYAKENVSKLADRFEYVELPIVVHRPLPEGRVMWAWIKVSRVGLRQRYELQLTIESTKLPKKRCGKGVVGVDLGWRALADGSIRVAYAAGDDGWTDEVRISAQPEVGSRRQHGMRDALEYDSVLRKHVDDHRNTVKAELGKWLSEKTVPDWVRADCRYLAQWKTSSKLAALAHAWCEETFSGRALVGALWDRWRKERIKKGKDLFAGREEITAWLASKDVADPVEQFVLYLEWWRKKDRHLYQWECEQRQKARGWRNETFRQWAAKLAARYETIVVEQFNIAKVARKKRTEESESEQEKKQRSIRQLAAPSKLRDALYLMAGKSRVVERDPWKTTWECSFCGHYNKFDAAAALVNCCEKCLKREDQDLRAAKVLVKRFQRWVAAGRPEKETRRLEADPQGAEA